MVPCVVARPPLPASIRFLTMSDAGSRHLALSFSRFANRFPLGHPPGLDGGPSAPADQTMCYLPHPY